MSKKILALMFMVMAIGLMGANNKEGCGGPPPCNYEGTLYHSGDSFPSSDGCNKCSCLNGQVSCTEMACVKTCKYNGKIYKEGDSFPSSDGCNKCSCKGGAVVCTKKACSNTCGGIAGLKCAKGQVCLYPAGTCKLADGAGKCVKKVKFCPKHYQPVCGCDGKTYGNSCEALQAGVTVDYKGKCKSKPKTCGTRGGIKCQKGEYCRFDGGHCGATDKGGSCQKVPTVCPKNYLPVCGCDGKTYGNSCDAARRGVSVEYKGKCKSKPQKCNSDCDCLKSTGVCHQGTCQPLRRATICPQCDSSYCKPGMACVDKTGTVGVCSSGGKSCKYNGKIYKNGASFPSADGCNKCGCKNGQVVCTQMACPPKKVCGTRGGTKCQKGQYCRFDGGHCGATDRGGSCQKIPGVCPKSYQPVCGCDGKTYGNSCDAARRGVSVKYKGKCKAMPKKCKTDCDCVTIGKVCQNGICLALRRKNMCPQCGSSVCKPGMPCYNGKMGTIGVCPNNRKSCKYNGKIYADGASFPATDGCNKCGCQNGQVACTKIGCPPKKVCGTRGGIQCQKGQYCRFDGGHCGTYDKGGSCQPIPNGCTKHYAPVCGCNGKTYGNSCMAAAAGVSLKYKGKCNVAPKKCKSDCDCVTIGRACQSGVCAAVKRMNMCPQCGGPACKPGLTCFNGKTLGVCSSGGMSCKYNGKIYKNGASFPAGDGCNKCGCQNGQVVCTKMACPKKCGGIAGLRCSKGYACIKPTGTCNVADGMGTCVRQGMACTQQYMPVCGCNGKTYGNSCSAAQSGMSVNYKGKCKTSAPKCKSDCDCIKIGRVCHLGTCQPLKRMNMCPQCGSSVCKPGMPCYNGKMGTIGVCAGSKTCGVLGGMRCTSNEFCSFKPGTCGKVGGTCTRSPGACPRIHKPVCACNGRTYSNYCVANVQGQSVKYNGRCRTPAP